MKLLNFVIGAVAAIALGVAGPGRAAAQDKVSVGVFPVSSSLPYFVALERGFFKEQNIAPEMTRLIGGPPNVAALITNGSTEQLRSHLARAIDNGLSEAELKEVIIHLAFYAGWPRAMSAVTVAKEIFGA
jgi:alkylhydroperoxidase/carboxymuconolactone decarboxylase family protein YurZ